MGNLLYPIKKVLLYTYFTIKFQILVQELLASLRLQLVERELVL